MTMYEILNYLSISERQVPGYNWDAMVSTLINKYPNLAGDSSLRSE